MDEAVAAATLARGMTFFISLFFAITTITQNQFQSRNGC
jgi:hypothetical protein